MILAKAHLTGTEPPDDPNEVTLTFEMFEF